MFDIQKFIDQLVAGAAIYVPKVLLAILALIIGFSIINRIVGSLSKALTRSDNPTLNNFIRTLISVLFKVALLISVASILGIETTSFVAVLGAATFAIGLALQGSLANFAGGVLLILFRPFKQGDFIEAQGFTGIVKEISIFVTTLKTLDNRLIFIPNGPLAGGSLVNYSAEADRRVDMVFGIAYEADFEEAKAILNKLIEADDRIYKKEGFEPFVRVTELADSSVNITARMWAKGSDYWGIHLDMLENVKREFDKAQISIPYPHMEVYSHQVN